MAWLNATAVAKMFGAKVIVIDTVPNRLALAKRFGADEIVSMDEYKTVEERIEKIMSLTNGVGADVVMELTGVPSGSS